MRLATAGRRGASRAERACPISIVLILNLLKNDESPPASGFFRI
jgi:hypothetical protein